VPGQAGFGAATYTAPSSERATNVARPARRRRRRPGRKRSAAPPLRHRCGRAGALRATISDAVPPGRELEPNVPGRPITLPRVPKYCRHGALAERCPICHASIEEEVRAATRQQRPAARRGPTDTRPHSNLSSRSRLTVRHEARASDDGFRTALAPGLRATEDGQRLAAEIGFANGRLAVLALDPPGLYGEIAGERDVEEANWLAFLVAYLGPLEDEADPFAGIEEVRTPWGELPALDGARLGPRSAHDPQRGTATIEAYIRFAQRAGSQAAALGADPSWTAEQRFERVHERLALPGLRGRARYDLLVTLGLLGRYPLTAPGLLTGDDDPVTSAAKRVFGIGDRMILERRARELAAAAQVPVEALDLALENWARAERITQGTPGAADPAAAERARAALDC
jgi:hypothetical protein